MWLRIAVLALFGYALLGKGFAYLYIGEITLVIGFLIFIPSRKFMLLFSDPVLLIWLVFSFWGACRTIPYIPIYHFDAIRDAVLWGYGCYALLIAGFVDDDSYIRRAMAAYNKFVPWYSVLIPGVLLVSLTLHAQLPTIPWSDSVAIISMKGGDAAVNLCSVALFTLLFSKWTARHREGGLSLVKLLSFAGWTFAAFLVLIDTRAGFLALALPLFLISVLKPSGIGWKVAVMGIISCVLMAAVLESDLITFTVKGRTFTVDQVNENLGSIVGQGSAGNTEGTKQWRLQWWQNIINDTIFGPYFWKGKGFGLNLATDSGPHADAEDAKLRSPHNASMTVLARMGVPGLFLWILLHGVFVFRVIRAYRQASRMKLAGWAALDLWVLCYWFSAFINMSFDVYVEGPMGGIWFWAMIGFGIAVIRLQERDVRLIRATYAEQHRDDFLQRPVPAPVHARTLTSLNPGPNDGVWS